MPTLYIHVGSPKTGTTALQSFLYNNRNILAKTVNLYYPSTGANPERGGTHQDLFPVHRKVWTQLRNETYAFPGCDLVLSEEILWGKSFSNLKQEHLSTIRQLFSEYNIKIVVYLRRIDDHFKSVFAQLTTNEKYFKKNSYMDFFQGHKNAYKILTKKIEIAIGLVGRENVLFRLYDKNSLKDGDIITDFFDLLGRDMPAGVRPPSKSNPSMPPQALPFLSKALLPLAFDDPLRKEIIELLQKVYAFPQGSGVGDDRLAEFEEEIDRIDAYVPGYKNLFAERRLSFSFPEVDVKDPQALFLAALLYRLLLNQQNGGSAKTNIKACFKRHAPRICVALRTIRNRCALLKKKVFSRGA